MHMLAHTGEGQGWGLPVEPWELHPALVHFPIAFLLGGVALDLYAGWRGRPDLARTATGLLAAGWLTGVVAALAGVVAFATVPGHTPTAHRLMFWHIGIQATALALFTWPMWVGMRTRAAPTRAARAAGWAGALALTVGSGIGGYIVYHGGAGIDPDLLAPDVRQGHGGHGDSGSSPKGDGHGGHKGSETPAPKGHGHEGHESPAATSKSSGSPSPKESAGHPAGHGQGDQAGGDARHASADQPQKAGAAPKEPPKGRSPEALPTVPRPDAGAAQVPAGYRVEVVLADLTYPTSVAFDDAGAMYVAEAGFNYGDEVAAARILRIPPKGEKEIFADGLTGPVTDLLWHDKRLYISHRGKISVLEGGKVRDLVTGLPSLGDHHNNQLAVGPDGKIYFGQGTATNAGVVGLDNFKAGWLSKYPDVHDVPAKDIRLQSEGFETPDFLSLVAGPGEGHGSHGAKGGGNDKGKGRDGHEKGKTPAQKKEVGAGSAKGKGPAKGEGHEGHDPKANDPKKDQKKDAGHDGHGAGGAGPDKAGGQQGHRMVKTFGFQPFGKTPPDDGAIRGQVKASGTILRMDPDGSNLEVYAWGLRNPFGLAWGPDKKLYASDNGYDERGSRPIAHAPDCLWAIKQGAWYGFPDYAGGVPVTDSKFRPENGPAPKFLMRDHPPVEKPLVALKNHVGAAGLAVGPAGPFGHDGHLFLALSGDMNPITGMHEDRSGFEVVRIDHQTGKAETFFKARKDALGPKGTEYVATAGPRRPVGVRFAPDGGLYVVDVGSMAIVPTATGPVPRPFPGTGIVWRITREASPAR